MATVNKRSKGDLTQGSLFGKMILFALPIMLTGMLQILYNMSDNIVVGQFSGDPDALGAVGSTASLTNLIINLLLGIAGGTGVLVAQRYGAGQKRDVSRAVHTSLVFALVGGIAFAIFGFVIARPALELMGTKEVLLDKATLYLKIICIGIPATSVYNFGASVLRSVGDSKTPLFILASTGLINVVLNLIFVMCCGMAVEGVALATIISQYLSAIAVVVVLAYHKNECYAFSFKSLCFDRALLIKILRFGIPAGVQSSLFSFTNVVLTSGINTFPDTTTITAFTVANNIDAITYTVCNSFMHTAMTFAGQNYGARKYDRIKRVLLIALLQAVACGVIIAQIELLFGRQLASLYIDADNPNKEAIIETTMQIMRLLLNTYFLCGVMEAFSGTLRGVGRSFGPMMMSLIGICGVRIFWIFAIFPLEPFNTLTGLLLTYPISWFLTSLMLGILFMFAWHSLKKLRNTEKATALADEITE